MHASARSLTLTYFE